MLKEVGPDDVLDDGRIAAAAAIDTSLNRVQNAGQKSESELDKAGREKDRVSKNVV